jgi:hypothetical protein
LYISTETYTPKQPTSVLLMDKSGSTDEPDIVSRSADIGQRHFKHKIQESAKI